MPLLDHFHPPLSVERHWESFHAAWCGSLADELNRLLPDNYFAEEQPHSGPSVEIAVATFERQTASPASQNGGAPTTLTAAMWAPPAPAFSVAAVFADDFEVRVFNTRTGPRLVAAIEMVSPRNKDRPESRPAFVHKCASYLYQGISLILVDVVTDRHAQFHNDLLREINAAAELLQPPEVRLYAAAYHPVRRGQREEIDVWPAALALGAPLPVLPLALNADLVLPVDLEATYAHACRRRRIA